MYSLSTYGQGGGAPSVDVAEVAGRLPMHAAQVVHGSVEGDPHSLPDAGVPALHHFQLVYRLIDAQGHHFGLGEPLPLKENRCNSENRTPLRVHVTV